MQNSIYKIKYLLFLSWDWEPWCLSQSGGVIPPPKETLLCCLFTYCQFFTNFCNHQIVISITLSSPERSYIECTQMSSIYPYGINLVVSLPIRSGPGVLMNVLVSEQLDF